MSIKPLKALASLAVTLTLGLLRSIACMFMPLSLVFHGDFSGRKG
jgi:hypothetical protein